MKRSWCYLLFLGWMSYMMIAGLFLFTSGFLLHRVARPERSQCVDCTEACTTSLKNPDRVASSCHPTKTKVVLLVVDALKYEFVKWHDGTESLSTYHRNKIPIVTQMMRKEPDKTRLYKFIADPPTTTLQRLKALVTGTLPTFIDIGSNFATDEINEDNLIDQKANGIVFMGDDTWTHLFPKRFLRQFPSPSFNMWDLDTVDREVRNRIYFEMKKNDWSFLIAHALGVDHCGHKHGPHHPEMSRKLNETNTLIKEIIEGLSDNSMLFVIGDHGMTDTGDHGGDSPNEVEAALFVYSKIPLFKLDKIADSVNQNDLVPTLASILGMAVPFSNLGTTILDALPLVDIEVPKNSTHDSAIVYPLISLWKNVAQIHKYINFYSADSFLFTKEKLEALNEMYSMLAREVTRVNDVEDFKVFNGKARDYLKLVRDTCTDIWVQFDTSLMTYGLVLMCCSLFLSYVLVNGVFEYEFSKIMETSFLFYVTLANVITVILVGILYYANFIEDFRSSVLLATGYVSLCLQGTLVKSNWKSVTTKLFDFRKLRKVNYTARIVLLLTVCGLFSNSYVVEEDRVLSFLIVTLICLLVYNVLFNHKTLTNSVEKKTFSLTSHKVKLLAFGLVACVTMRLSSYFWRCREEHYQRPCSQYILGKAGALISNSYELKLSLLSIVVLVFYISLVRNWLRNCENLLGMAPSVIVAQYFPSVIVFLMGWYWARQRLPKILSMRPPQPWEVNFVPMIVYILITLAIFVIYYNPLNVLIARRRDELGENYESSNVIHRVFEQLKRSFSSKKQESKNSGSNESFEVIGLNTSYSAAFISLGVFLTLLHSLLLGDVLASSNFLMFVIYTSILGLTAIERFRTARNFGNYTLI